MRASEPPATSEFALLVSDFENRSGLQGVDHEVKQGLSRSTLVFQLAHPTERFYRILEVLVCDREWGEESTATIQKRTPSNRLSCPEAKYLIRTLSESLNISRLSFKEDFFSRYTRSVSNAESQIVASANHIVYGRRGAGKSSLLLYALRTREGSNQPSAWLDMQVFQNRADTGVFTTVLHSIVEQLKPLLGGSPQICGHRIPARRA
jgi:hypothetical protein